MPEVDSGVRHRAVDVARMRELVASAKVRGRKAEAVRRRLSGRSDADLRRMLDGIGALAPNDGGPSHGREPRVDQAVYVENLLRRQLGPEHPQARAAALRVKQVRDAAELRLLFEHFSELRDPEALAALHESALEEHRERGHLFPPPDDPASAERMREGPAGRAVIGQRDGVQHRDSASPSGPTTYQPSLLRCS